MTTKDFKQKIYFKAKPEVLYEILMSSKLHGELTDSKAVISRKVGGRFKVYDGDITGKNIELVPNKKIVQRWRTSEWPAGHFSKVIFEFRDHKNGTELDFQHFDIPAYDIKNIKQGWKEYYWQPLAQLIKNLDISQFLY